LAEGAAILILEDWQHAVDRGYVGPPLALLSGYGASGDGFHVTAPDPAGQGAIRAMYGALTSSSFVSKTTTIDPADIQYVNAHATSTPKGDEIEANAINEYLGKAPGRSRPLWTSSTKGATGHLLGAAGALEAAFTVQSLKDQILPGTLNLESIDDPSNGLIDYVRQVHRLVDDDYRLVNAISNSFGFGGVNASLLFQSGDLVLESTQV
jgi:3-oxoacyl-[acyl-carrier-protein] synthase II